MSLPSPRIDFRTALTLTTGNANRHFVNKGDGSSGSERIREIFPTVFHTPKFFLQKDETFFTIGSCFARNIERSLAAMGVKNLTAECIFDDALYEQTGVGARNGALNAYTPHSMLALLRLNSRADKGIAGTLQVAENEHVDMMMSGLRTLTTDELRATRGKMLGTYERLKEASVCVLTLGYTESWYDMQDQIAVNKSPGGTRKLMRLGDRYCFFSASPTEVCETLRETIAEIREQTEERCKIILSVSPVPLQRTWTDRDIVIANLYSKATLLAAANSVAMEFNYVDYFPSYEMVTYGDQTNAWKGDGIHVNPLRVDRVIKVFADRYFK